MLQAELDALVLQAQGGNEQALSCLIQALHPHLLAFACQFCGDKDLAQDAVQEAWIKGIKSLSTLQDPRVLKAWMIRAVKWRLLDLIRQRGKLVEEPVVEEPLTMEADSEQSLSLVQLVSGLPSAEKEAVLLFYQQECQLNEIALIQSVPLGTVKSRLNRAKQKIKHALEKQNEPR